LVWDEDGKVKKGLPPRLMQLDGQLGGVEGEIGGRGILGWDAEALMPAAAWLTMSEGIASRSSSSRQAH
jgi:hypothetical protein